MMKLLHFSSLSAVLLSNQPHLKDVAVCLLWLFWGNWIEKSTIVNIEKGLQKDKTNKHVNIYPMI